MKFPDWVTPERTVELTGIEIAGVIYPVVVMPRDVEPKLPCFIGFPESRDFLFVSVDVPENFRAPMLIHEVYEVGLEETDDQCLLALKHELTLVPAEIFHDYLVMREIQFASLIKFHGESGVPSRVRLAEKMAHSLKYIEERLGH